MFTQQGAGVSPASRPSGQYGGHQFPHKETNLVVDKLLASVAVIILSILEANRYPIEGDF